MVLLGPGNRAAAARRASARTVVRCGAAVVRQTAWEACPNQTQADWLLDAVRYGCQGGMHAREQVHRCITGTTTPTKTSALGNFDGRHMLGNAA